MATTNCAFAKLTTGGSTVLVALAENLVSSLVSTAGATRVDKVTSNLATAGYALNGAARYTLSGTTVKTIDLTSLSTGAAAYTGDVTFAKYAQLILYNDGAAAVTVGSGASNGATMPLSGTVTVDAGQFVVLTRASAVTVDGSHKTIDVTPTSGGSFVIAVGGQ